LAQVKELFDKTPYQTLESDYLSLKNCDYTNSIGWSKDCYLTFFADYSENVYYSSILDHVRYSMDCLQLKDSELCYELSRGTKCYRTFFSEECEACVDVWFSRNCYGCTDCIGCVNLRGATHSIFNKKYSKEEYEAKKKEFRLYSFKNLETLKKKAEVFWQIKPRREYCGNPLNYNVTGEYVYESKNSKEMYMVIGAENSKWCELISLGPIGDCFDYVSWGSNSSLIYEAAAVGENSSQVCFSVQCFPDSLNLQYCFWNIAGKNNFGCVNLKRKKYCILNKQYSKEEYEKLKAKIIADMRVNPYVDSLGRKFYYGDFFPPEFSPHPYNKSLAMRFIPKTKKEVLKEGYFWEEISNPGYKISIEASSLPDTIEEISLSIFDQVIRCQNCKRGYKITKGEVELLRKMNLPLPRECPKCREERRFNRLNKPKFYDRNCAKCGKKIRTAFSPAESDIVYCEKCYQAEFL